MKAVGKILGLIVINMTLLVSASQAQTGPEIPCVNCEQYTQRTEPSNGLWHNQDQRAQGFGLEIQNGQVGGIYYGYDEAGVAIWLVFSAALVASEEPGVMWTLDATLNQFSNGNCFNCEIKVADVAVQGQIRIKFRHKNHASVSLDNGPWQNITPIIFGASATANFPNKTEYLLPDLEGMWSFIYHANADAVADIVLVPNQWGFTSEALWIARKNITQTAAGREVTYSVERYFPQTENQVAGEITCKSVDVSGQLQGPTCVYATDSSFWFDLPGVWRFFKFPLSGLGAYRVFGETIDGHTIEAIKVDSTPFTD